MLAGDIVADGLQGKSGPAWGSMALPTRMKALVRSAAKTDPDRPSMALELSERPVPVPGRGEVLVEMEAAGCNLRSGALAGTYAVSQSPGDICGFEAAAGSSRQAAGCSGAI